MRHAYEVRPRKDNRGVDLISDVLPFGQLWYGEPNAISNAIGYVMHRSRSHPAVIRVYDAAGNVIETHEHKGESSTYTRFGSTLTITGERDGP
jgi:YD repeat-containing protein